MNLPKDFLRLRILLHAEHILCIYEVAEGLRGRGVPTSWCVFVQFLGKVFLRMARRTCRNSIMWQDLALLLKCYLTARERQNPVPTMTCCIMLQNKADNDHTLQYKADNDCMLPYTQLPHVTVQQTMTACYNMLQGKTAETQELSILPKCGRN